MSDSEFFSFDDALKELRLKEEELKRLVSEGEIRAFREGDTMKLRRTDVESLRAELSGGDVVDLGDVTEDLVFEDDDMLEETGMATEEISDVDTIIEDDVEDVGELDLDEDEVEDLGEEEEVEEVRPVRRTAAASAVVEEETEGIGIRFALIGTSILLILAIPVCIAVSTGKVGSLAAGIAGILFKIPQS